MQSCAIIILMMIIEYLKENNISTLWPRVLFKKTKCICRYEDWEIESWHNIVYRSMMTNRIISHWSLSFFFATSNIKFFINRVIQWSHPACNTVMLCGCCICLGAAVALGVDGRWVQPQHFAGLCAARAWLLATGFSMAYGAMFTKVWRVHRHTTKPKPETKVLSHRHNHNNLF